jgi:Pyruvate/2-oxoacid:ferredoxin oxidoreductase gamma subunit
VERDLLMTGIGGQGIQLAAQLLARAAIAEGREVQLFGSYGGMMRGGNTDTTLVIGDGPIEAPPTTDRAWAAIVMHHEFAAPTLAHVRPGGLVFANTNLVAIPLEISGAERSPDEDALIVVGVAATDLAVDTGNILAAAMVMIGAFAATTGLVDVASLVAAVPDALPAYRRQHVKLNQAALTLGAANVPTLVTEITAWGSPTALATGSER